MKKKSCSLLLVVCVFMLGLTAVSWSADYVGSAKCFKCHKNQYNDFRTSGHPYKLQKAEIAKSWPLPLPKGYTWRDISYVIGGAYKKARYMNKQGYIITASRSGRELKTQYNLETGTWSFYHKGEKKPYDCGRCHTTGFSEEGHQDGLEGIKGTWAFPGVQCEACHGPGSDHLKDYRKFKPVVDRTSARCGKCHIRGSRDKIPASGNFIKHHEQYNELLASPHKELGCVECHNPHKKAEFSIKKECASCHKKQAAAFKGHVMAQVGVKCIDCHMPRATKSAVKKAEYEGDIRSHVFKINLDSSAKMFYTEEKDGKKLKFARGFVTVEYACLNCHKNKDKEWAAAQGKTIHKTKTKK